MAENLNDMSFDALVPSTSKYLKKEDVGEGGVILTIRGFKREVLKDDDGGEEEKIVMYFQEADYKPMVVNKTNAQLISVATGAKVAGHSIGKEIIVYSDPTVGFGGKITGGLRIRRVPGNVENQAPRRPVNVKTAGEAMEDFPDDVPFN